MEFIKNVFLVTLIVFIPFLNYSQKSEKARISQIEEEISVAVDEGDYEKAASLKNEKETLEEIVVALEEGDYEQAATLKKELENGYSDNGLADTKSKLAEVDVKISEAVEAGEYQKAAELKKEKELLEELIVAQENDDSDKIEEIQNQLANGTTISNTTSKDISPEFNNQVYMWNKSSNKLKSLEKQKGTIETSTSASPFHAKSTSFYKVDGLYSSVRIENNKSYVIKVVSGQDPRDLVELVIFKPGNDNKDRYMPYYESSGHAYGASSGEVKDVKIPISIKKVKDGVYEIITDETLKDGEYGFKVIDKFYCFGVGPKGAASKDQGEASPPTPPEDKGEIKSTKLTKNGYFIDFMLGVGSNTELIGVAIVPGFRMGNRFYSKNNSMFKPGFSLNYARVQIGLSPGANHYYASINPVGVGFATITQFSDKAGLEVNIDAMVNIFIYNGAGEASAGALISPNVKFRYNSLAIGIDFAITPGAYPDAANTFRSTSTFAFTAGFKF
jgi:hypothetical protein